MNRTLSYGAKLLAHLDPSKGVGSFRQQDGGHGSRNPLRSVYPSCCTQQFALLIDDKELVRSDLETV